MEKLTYDVTCQGREGSLGFDRFHFFFLLPFWEKKGQERILGMEQGFSHTW